MSKDIFGCHTGKGFATGTQWVEARNAAKHPLMLRSHRPLSKESCANSAEVETPSLIKTRVLWQPDMERATQIISFPEIMS